MNDIEEEIDETTGEQDLPAQELVPDRDVLMMEKTFPDTKAAGYKPADKKLLRNIIILVLFLIVAFVFLTFIVRSNSSGDQRGSVNSSKETEITSGRE